MEEDSVDVPTRQIVDGESHVDHIRSLGRKRKQRWDKKQQATKQARKDEEKKAIKTVKKRAMNGND